MLPVAKSAGLQVRCLPGPACPVWFDVHRLRQGLFHLLGFVLGSSGEGAVIKIELEERKEGTVLNLTASGERAAGKARVAASDPQHPPQELVRRLGMGIARAIFEAAGGEFNVERAAESMDVRVTFVRGGGR
jgi:hypothetical protein